MYTRKAKHRQRGEWLFMPTRWQGWWKTGIIFPQVPLPSPVIPSGFIHVKHKDMNEKPCEAERRREKGWERISCCQGNRHHGNDLINELAMNPSNMVVVKSCRSNYPSFIHAVQPGAAHEPWQTGASILLNPWLPGSSLQSCSEPAPRALEHGQHMPSHPSQPLAAKGQPARLAAGRPHSQRSQAACTAPAASRRWYWK